MKKIMSGLVLLVLMFIPVSAFSGGLWSLAKNSGLEIIPSNAYSIEVKGTNIRAYVFDVKRMNSICVSVWGSDSQTLQCKTYAEIELAEKVKTQNRGK